MVTKTRRTTMVRVWAALAAVMLLTAGLARGAAAQSGGSALVIVPEDPEVDWRADAEGRPESGLDPDAARALVGPRMPKAPTLGELMLTSLALPESVGDARVVVVLVPRVPERFNLLPR